MKSKNLNNSSRKTKKIIKRVFAEMLGEKSELGKISVSELCKRAEISRGAFYSHYDDIYGVAEDYENELIDKFFDTTKLLKPTDIGQFIDLFFDYIRENNDNYKLLCKSNDFLFAAKRLTLLAANKFLELSNRDDCYIKDKRHIALEINIFIDGLLCEYVKMCRGYASTDLDELYDYTKMWVKNFFSNRKGE